MRKKSSEARLSIWFLLMNLAFVRLAPVLICAEGASAAACAAAATEC